MKRLLKARYAYLLFGVLTAVFALTALSAPAAAYEQQGEHEGQFGDDERDSDNDGEPNCIDCNDGNDADGDGRDFDKRDNDQDNNDGDQNNQNCHDDDDNEDYDGDGNDNDNNDYDNDNEEDCDDDNDGKDSDGDGYDTDTRVLNIFPPEDGNDGDDGAPTGCTASQSGTSNLWLLAVSLACFGAAFVPRRRTNS